MQISKLSLKNFRCFEDFELELHPGCTVLVGINGSGKTSVLDGLCVALGSWFLGFPDLTPRSIYSDEVRRVLVEHDRYDPDLEPRYPTRVEVSGQVFEHELDWARELRSETGKTTYGDAVRLKELASEYYEKLSDVDEPLDLPVIAYYGTSRLWVQKQNSALKEQGLTSRSSGYQDCLEPASNHKLFAAWLRRRTLLRLEEAAKQPDALSRLSFLQSQPDHALEAIKSAAAGCLDEVESLNYSIKQEDIVITFARSVRGVAGGAQVPFSRLSDGYRNLIAMAADIAWRAVRLNPHKIEDMPGEAVGVVLIDEVALHLHPRWQRDVLPALRRVFPKIQFVVTTHSPQVLSNVEASCVRFLQVDEDSVEARQPLVSQGLDTNTILRDLMEVPERPVEYARRFEELERQIQEQQFEEAEALLAALERELGQDDPVLVGLAWELADEKSHAHDN